MRRQLSGRTGTALAFVLGALIATAATAGAASLITGKQIKDGTITAKDLSKALRAQIARTGAPGPQGPAGGDGAPGSKGDPGPVLDVVPSGKTIRGVYDVGGSSSAANDIISGGVTFPIPMPARLKTHFVAAGAVPPSPCAGGTPQAPRADPGQLCVFENASLGTGPTLPSDILDPATNEGEVTNVAGFGIFFRATVASTYVGSRGTWAATAP